MTYGAIGLVLLVMFSPLLAWSWHAQAGKGAVRAPRGITRARAMLLLGGVLVAFLLIKHQFN